MNRLLATEAANVLSAFGRQAVAITG